MHTAILEKKKKGRKKEKEVEVGVFIKKMFFKQKWLWVNVGYLNVVTPSFIRLTLKCFDVGVGVGGDHCDPHLKFLLGTLILEQFSTLCLLKYFKTSAFVSEPANWIVFESLI